MLKQTWPQMVISQCGPPAILASHPFSEECGKNGAPPFVCDLELRGWNVGLARPILRPKVHHTKAGALAREPGDPVSVCGSTVTITSSSRVRKRSLRIANFTPCLPGMDVPHEPMVSFRSGFLAYRANLISKSPILPARPDEIRWRLFRLVRPKWQVARAALRRR